MLFLQGKITEASGLYDAIISRYPQSPRALYGKASVLNKMAEEKKSNAFLEQAISEFLNILSLPDVPKSLAIKTAKTCAERQSFRGYLRRYHANAVYIFLSLFCCHL